MTTRKALLKALVKAYKETRETKRNTLAQLEFEFDWEHMLSELCDAILELRYTPGDAVCFIREDPVKREIFASCFSHRVICRLLYDCLLPLFEPAMIYDSYSCREGKGVWKGIERMDHHIRSVTQNYTRPAYGLSGDFQGYFMSIDKGILYRTILDYIRPREDKVPFLDIVYYLLPIIIFRDPTENCIVLGCRRDWIGLASSKTIWGKNGKEGLAIGDITSQLFSNILLNIFDQYMKRKLGCKWYGRYVDDWYVLHPSRAFLELVLEEARHFARDVLHVKVHPTKVTIRPLEEGIQFLGAFFLPYRIVPAKKSVGRLHRKVRMMEKYVVDHADSISFDDLSSMRSSLNSLLGHFSKFKAYRMLDKLFKDSPLKEYFVFASDYSKVTLKKKHKQKSHTSGIMAFFYGLEPWEYGTWDVYA